MAAASRHGQDERRFRSANDRFKAGWGHRLSWSVVAAVIGHLALFGFWPAWERLRPTPESEPIELVQFELGGLLDEGGPDPLGAPPTVRPVGDRPDSVPPDVRGRVASAEPEIGELGDDVRERLRRRTRMVPTMAQPTFAPEVAEPDEEAEVEASRDEEEPAGEGGGTEIGGGASATELLTAFDSASLDLDRLSSIEPEVALVMPSNWVLIRNPAEVEAFIRRSYRRGELDRGASGRVSIALWIDERGSVEWAEVSESSGQRQLDEVALALFSEIAAFRAARVEGVPTSRSVIFSVSFPW